MDDTTTKPLEVTPLDATNGSAGTQIMADSLTLAYDESSHATYSNLCRVTGTPEELIVDFGLNPQPFGVPTLPIPLTQRIVMNFYTAKRMLHALSMTVQRHEATFGVLETDVQKRVQPATMGQPRG